MTMNSSYLVTSGVIKGDYLETYKVSLTNGDFIAIDADEFTVDDNNNLVFKVGGQTVAYVPNDKYYYVKVINKTETEDSDDE
jgi:hypothetical protein